MSDFALRPFSRDEFDAASEVAELAFLMTGRPEDRAVFAAGLEWDRTLGAFAGDRIVATAGIYTFELTVPGAIAPAAGVTIVTVHPTHRRRGILSSMMDRQFADLHEGGESIAVLRASESSIYGRFGYATATREVSVALDRVTAGFVPDAPGAGSAELELAVPNDVRKQLAEVYDAVRPGTPGFIGRNEPAWAHTVYDPEHGRGGGTPQRAALLQDGSATRGYVLYRVHEHWADELPASRVEVNELVAVDPAAAVALWQHVLDIDLTATASAWGRPVDEPLLRLLADPRRARVRMRDGLWLRLIRLDDALAARRYAAPVDVVLEVTDTRCPWNAGRHRLAGDRNGATCEPATDAADLRLDTTALAAAYLGDPVLGTYASTGRLEELRPGALLELATAMSWTPGPWCPHHF